MAKSPRAVGLLQGLQGYHAHALHCSFRDAALCAGKLLLTLLLQTIAASQNMATVTASQHAQKQCADPNAATIRSCHESCYIAGFGMHFDCLFDRA